MAKFMGKSILLVLLLFLGVLVGMQLATNNMNDMQGNEIQMNVKEQKEEEKQLTSHQLEEKAKKLEDIQTFNAFSEAGSTVSNLVEGGFESTIDVVLERLVNILAK
ncbi:DUF3679 domain-containing protein [Priestia taiwanensis]|uniref:DUF3679 domain-containing protein n=1 Tax=Priestia taiwanensis TaxID=1347902 RepID=A0A917ESK8_9BACI|nr:DUF3679 domain-containing protein [Priestia taiwanensis]MBM7363729.1 hypothetical protein [Priestia taiwanensis]GGE74598.1 hypothetical protein GCM10007140_25580 [Priestia taiwanensis]